MESTDAFSVLRMWGTERNRRDERSGRDDLVAVDHRAVWDGSLQVEPTTSNCTDVTIIADYHIHQPPLSHIRDHRSCLETAWEAMLDRRTTLCLACSSSLPPNVDDSELFMTKCCGRPICPRCLEANPRLARYNPCLACLAGVGVIQASSSAKNRSGGKDAGSSGVRPVKVENLDGGVKDRDLFVLADEEDSDEDDGDDVNTDGEEDERVRRSAAPPPPDVVPGASSLLETPPPPPVTNYTEEPPTTSAPLSEDQQSAKPDAPVVYRLRRGDTLMGIALRFRLDVRLFYGLRLFCLTDPAVRQWSCAG